MLGAAENTVWNMVIVENGLDVVDHLGNLLVTFAFAVGDELLDVLVFSWIEILEAQIFEFVFTCEIPRRWAIGAYTRSVSRAMRFCADSDWYSSVRML